MASGNVKEDLKAALDESTSEQKLRKIWTSSRSVKVRKAVASNPNAGPQLLKEAARLYLEEVLENPGFSMLELFDDDPWISKVSLAYSDPWDFLIKHVSASYYNRAVHFDYFGWAALLSPKLNATALDRIITFMTTGGLRRALKTPSTMERVRGLYVSSDVSDQVWPFSLETMIVLYKEGAITSMQLFDGMSNFAVGSTSMRKSVFSKYIKDLHQEYLTSRSTAQAEFTPKLIAKSLIISRSHVMHWLWNCFTNKQLDDWAGELYAKVLRYMISYSKSKSHLVYDNIRTVGSLVAQHLKNNIITDSPTKETLTQAYSFVATNGLQDQKFSKYGFLLHKGAGIAALGECGMEVKEFFCKAGCIGNWASATGSDIKYRIINEVNEHIYSREGVGYGNLLFDKCSLRKVVSLDEDTYVF